MELPYETLSKLMGFLDTNLHKSNVNLFSDEENPNPLETGVSIAMLRKFCNRYRCSMYAYDADDELVEFYKPDGFDTENHHHKAPLIFRCWNKHFYPIEDEKERKSKEI
jgi:hypothetical protein